MPRTKRKENYAVRSKFTGYSVKKYICKQTNLVAKEYIQNNLDLSLEKCYGDTLTNQPASLLRDPPKYLQRVD